MEPVAALLLAHATVLDGVGEAQPDTDILIVAGRVEAIGRALVAPLGGRVLDGSGMVVTPGLIDAHVHLMNLPGEPYLALDDPAHDAIVRAQLRAYVACGVTTVLDAATHPDRMAEIQGWIRAGHPAPRVLSLGPALGPAGGYPSVLDPAFPGLAHPSDVGPALDLAVSSGAIGAKITVEGGFGSSRYPTFDAEMRAALRTEAGARGLPLFVHAMSPRDHVASLDLQPHAWLHGPERPMRRATEAIALSGAFVVSTLTVYDANLVPMNAAILADPLLQTVVPAREYAAALDRGIVNRAREDVAAFAVPWAPRWAVHDDGIARWLAGVRLRSAVAAIRELHAAGVPIVLGTDAGTWPFIQGQFHGWSAIRELELLGEAGLSPAEAIAAGTSVSARMLGLEHEIGTIEVGKAADLVVLRADPRAGLSAFREIAWSIRAGEARTPAEWMASP